MPRKKKLSVVQKFNNRKKKRLAKARMVITKNIKRKIFKATARRSKYERLRNIKNNNIAVENKREFAKAMGI